MFLIVPWKMFSILKTCLLTYFCVACMSKWYKFEAWPDKYVLKDINNNVKVVSFGPIDHESSLYKFTGFYSTKSQPFYPYVAHADGLSK